MQQLVIQGVYRHVCNPMISGVMAVPPDEAIRVASLPPFCRFLAFFTVNAVDILLSEEPGWIERFGKNDEICGVKELVGGHWMRGGQ